MVSRTYLTKISLALFLLGLVSVSAVKKPKLWRPIGEHAKEIYEMYGNPAESAAEDLTKVIRGELFSESEKEERIWTGAIQGLYIPSILPSIVENEQCRHDTLQIILAWTVYMGDLLEKYGTFWQLLMPDSWGKVGDGVLNGNNFAWGYKEECVDIKADNYIDPPNLLTPPLNVTFKGNYCLVHIRNKTNYVNMKDNRFDFTIDDAVQFTLDVYGTPTDYFYGTCMSSGCTDEDLRVSVAHELNDTEWEVVDVQCRTSDEAGDFTSSDIAFIVIVSIMWFLIIIAAVVDLTINLYKAHEYRKGPLKYLLAFSAYSNLQSVFRITNKTNPDVIDCLHGMRALSMIWVTWGHSYTLFLKVTQNLLGLKPFTTNLATQIIFNGSFSVDTFFFISGLLAAYSVLREHDITGKVNWLMYYVHRIVRLLPSIALTCFFMATIARHAVVGPYGPYVDKENLQNCRDYWYMDVFFASNFVDGNSRCLPQSWYTSIDCQLYAILPIVLIPLILKPKIGLGILSLVTITTFVIPTSLFYAYDLKPYLPFVIPEVEPMDTSLNQNTMPWNRASPYFVGVLAGWLLFRFREKKIKMSWVAAIIGWLVSATIASLVLFGMAAYNTLDEPKVLPSGISIAYGGLSRGAWGLALLWVVFACQKGYGGPINTFLGHPALVPLSRLAFTMYLITVPVQILTTGGTYIPLYMNHLNKFIETCGYLFFGGLMAIGVAITAELPFLSFEKVLIPRPGRNVQEELPKES